MKIIFTIPIFFSMLPILAHDNFIHINHLGCDWHFDTNDRISLLSNSDISVKNSRYVLNYTISNKSHPVNEQFPLIKKVNIGDFKIQLYSNNSPQKIFFIKIDNKYYGDKSIRVGGKLEQLTKSFWHKFNLCQVSYSPSILAKKEHKPKRYIVSYFCNEKCSFDNIKISELSENFYENKKQIEEIDNFIKQIEILNDKNSILE